MSNIYIKEPSTDGKVLLQTTVGDIDIELWSKEAPLACRNFVQLCMEGYYDGVIFHRVVPGFIVQGGDPTGTGTGGESIYGKPFKDEFHQRLRFVRRGLVAMANSGPNDNSSQFFFTLGTCNDLNKKHTIFGKVTGDTVYNMIRLGDVSVDTNERPINPPSIKKAKVLANPFDDIIPRVEPEKKKKVAEKKKKSQSRATKDYKLLSFGEEAEADEEESFEVRFKGSKSSHDLADDPHLSSKTAKDIESPKQGENVDQDQNSFSSSDEEIKSERTNRIRDKLTLKKDDKFDLAVNEKTSGDVSDKIKQMRKESRQIARELAKKKNEVVENTSSSDSDDEAVIQSNPIFAEYKAEQKQFREKTSVAKKKGFGREAETLQLLNSFKSKMLSVRKDANWNDSDDSDDNAKPKSKLPATNDDTDEEDNVGWLMHRFRNADSELRDAKDMNRDVNEDRYEITDPRNTLNKRRRMEKDDRGDRKRRHEHAHSRSDHRDRRERHHDRHRDHRR